MGSELASAVFGLRGFTFQGLPEGDYPFELVDWMAERGLNRLEIRVSGRQLGWPSAAFPELCSEGAGEQSRRLRELIVHGRECGVAVIPAIGHADGITELVKHHPEWHASGVIEHPTGADINKYNVCFSHPGVAGFYRTAVRELVEAVDPDEIQFWLTENALWCECPRCRETVGDHPFELTAAAFVKQARLFHECVAAASTADRQLAISLWTTQGSRPHNAGLVRSLPPAVLWFYYEGERRGCYNLRRRAAIPSEMADLRREGYTIAVQVDWYSCGSFLTTPGRIREICREAADCGLSGVVAWITAHPLNRTLDRGGASPILDYAAQMAVDPRGADGDSVANVMRGAALAVGHPVAVADVAGEAWDAIDRASRTIYLSDCYAYWWHGVNVPGAVCERIIRRAPVDELDQRWTDEAWDRTLPEVDAAVADMQQVAARLAATPDASGYLAHIAAQVKLIETWGTVCRWALWAGIVWHRMGAWDTSHGPWRDDRDELIGALEGAAKALSRVPDMWVDGHVLLRRPGDLHGRQRVAVLADQFRLALRAVREGASPARLPRQDAYPYN